MSRNARRDREVRRRRRLRELERQRRIAHRWGSWPNPLIRLQLPPELISFDGEGIQRLGVTVWRGNLLEVVRDAARRRAAGEQPPFEYAGGLVIQAVEGVEARFSLPPVDVAGDAELRRD